MSNGGKGDWIPGTNAKAYEAGYGQVDWNAREREAARRALEAAAAQVPSWSEERLALDAPEVPRLDPPHLFLGEPVILGFDPGAGDEMAILASCARPDGVITIEPIYGPKLQTFNRDDFGVLVIEERTEPDFTVPRPSWWRRAWDRITKALTAPCWDP